MKHENMQITRNHFNKRAKTSAQLLWIEDREVESRHCFYFLRFCFVRKRKYIDFCFELLSVSAFFPIHIFLTPVDLELIVSERFLDKWSDKQSADIMADFE
jgi:hypothetical protein